MKSNKGFSLVELIIVIAIMAILVGVMAPQLIKYIEKTNVSSDTQLCDTVKSAFTTAMLDPEVINADDANIPDNADWAKVSSIDDGAFKDAVEEILGKDVANLYIEIKSSPCKGTDNIYFKVVNSNSIHVSIDNSDASGKKTGHTKGELGSIYVD